jgi:hypothetical protein
VTVSASTSWRSESCASRTICVPPRRSRPRCSGRVRARAPAAPITQRTASDRQTSCRDRSVNLQPESALGRARSCGLEGRRWRTREPRASESDSGPRRGNRLGRAEQEGPEREKDRCNHRRHFDAPASVLQLADPGGDHRSRLHRGVIHGGAEQASCSAALLGRGRRARRGQHGGRSQKSQGGNDQGSMSSRHCYGRCHLRPQGTASVATGPGLQSPHAGDSYTVRPIALL